MILIPCAKTAQHLLANSSYECVYWYIVSECSKVTFHSYRALWDYEHMWNKLYDNLIYNIQKQLHVNVIIPLWGKCFYPTLIHLNGQEESRPVSVCLPQEWTSDEPVKHISDPQTSVPQAGPPRDREPGVFCPCMCVCVCEDIRPRACVWSAVCSGQRERTESERTSWLS